MYFYLSLYYIKHNSIEVISQVSNMLLFNRFLQEGRNCTMCSARERDWYHEYLTSDFDHQYGDLNVFRSLH
jgi:hypothetical protein